MGVTSRLLLNAFRHQRSKQSFQGFAGYGIVVVLNAFRHQRSKQVLDKRKDTLHKYEVCSTPFGIKDRSSLIYN